MFVVRCRSAETITEMARRKKFLTNLAANWLRNDRAAATEWILANGEFSVKEETALLR